MLEAIDKFTEFWNGSGPQDPLPASARLRMIERADKLAFDFTAAFAEENVAAAAASLRVPTLLLSGGLSPYLTQRIVQRLGAIIDGAEIRHLPGAGHMLPLTHAAIVNPAIARHIARADELAAVPLAVEAALAEAVSLARWGDTARPTLGSRSVVLISMARNRERNADDLCARATIAEAGPP